MAQSLAADAVWHVGGREPLDVLEGRDFLMSFTNVTANKEQGGDLDVIMADAMRFGPEGRVVEFWTLLNDQKAVDAFIG